MTPTQERLADALRMARLHVAASAGAEHMMDGFGPRSAQPSDLLLAEIDAVLAAHDAEQAALPQTCNTHPDAPHGFDRNGSHSEDRYVCKCESWVQPEQASAPEPVAWISHDVVTGVDRYDRLPIQSIQPGRYKYTRLYDAGTLAAEYRRGVLDGKYVAESEAELNTPPAPRVSVPFPTMWGIAEESAEGYRDRVIESLRAQGVEVVP